MQSQKRQNDLCSFPRQIIQYHGNLSLWPNQQCWRSWSWILLWRPTRPSRTTKKWCPFHHRGLEGKSRKSRDLWSNKQSWPWSTKWSRIEANRVCQENTLIIANTLFQQHKRWLYTWTASDGQYEIRLIIFFAVEDGQTLYSQQKKDLELTFAQIMRSLLQKWILSWRK